MNKDKLISPLFILGLIALLINDFYLKYNFPGLITGKLSDFTGLFIFPFFFSVFFPSKKRAIYILTGIGFIIWKLPVTDHILQIWNSNLFFKINRVVDYSDYWALFILPMSYFYNPSFPNNLNFRYKKIMRIGLTYLAMFSFIATAGTHGNIRIYTFNYSKKEVKQAIVSFYEHYPEYKIPEQYEKYTWHYTNTPPEEPSKMEKLNRLRADSVNFNFYIQVENKIFWTGFVLLEKEWNKSPCKLAFISIVIPGKKEKINDDLTSDEKQKYTSLFEKKVISKLKSILAKQKVASF